MNGKYNNRYKKRNATTGTISTVFVYLLSGGAEELERYKAITEAGGFPIHTDDASGKMLYFDTTYHGAVCKVIITDNDKIVVDNPTIDFLQSQMNLITDPTVKAAMAQQIASHMVSTIAGGVVTASAPAPVAQAQPEPAVAAEPTSEPAAEADPAVVAEGEPEAANLG